MFVVLKLINISVLIKNSCTEKMIKQFKIQIGNYTCVHFAYYTYIIFYFKLQFTFMLMFAFYNALVKYEHRDIDFIFIVQIEKSVSFKEIAA